MKKDLNVYTKKDDEDSKDIQKYLEYIKHTYFEYTVNNDYNYNKR